MSQRVKRAIAAAMSLTMAATATPVSPLYNAIQNAVSSVMMQASAADNKYIINYDNDTFSIASFDDLNMFAEAVNGGKTFENKTITLADNFDMGTKALTTPIGTYDHRFMGTFDGQGHNIKLDMNMPDVDFVGLFGCVKDATIRNITVTGYANCWLTAGGICGLADNSNIYNCTNIAEVTGYSTAGGILGYVGNGLNVYNCTNNAAVKAIDGIYGYAGGILGYAEVYAFPSVYNCANIATVTSGYGAGGICGYSRSSPLVHNCINIAAVSGQTDIGGICGGSDEDPYIDNCYVLNKFNENDVTVINAQQFKGTDKVSDNKTVTELLNDYVDKFNITDITLLEWEQGQDYPILKIPVSQDAYTKIEGTNLKWKLEDDGKLTISLIKTDETDTTKNAMPDWYGDIHSPWYNNTEITSVQIKDGVTNIGSDAFKGCSGLTSIAIPNSVTSFGGNAFNGCSKLTEITIPSGVTEIGRSAFENFSGLTSITIPSGVTTIGDYAFSDCSALTEVTIPSGVTSIGEWAFRGCELLESITLPSDVTIIGSRTFENCSALKEITIPSGVTRFSDNAFSGCTALTSIKFEGDVPEIKDNWEEEADAFEDVGETTPAILYYPKDNASWDNLLAENAESIAENGFLSWKGGYFTPEAYLNWNDIDETGLYWSISANGTLYIDKQETPSGSNFTIPDFDGNAPWKDYVNQIRFVNISKDVENVNDTSFKDLIGHAFLILEDGYNGTKPSPIDDSTYDSFGGGEFIYKTQAVGASLSLDGKIGVNISFYVNKDEGSTITINDETVDLSECECNGDIYTYTLWVAPKDAYNDIIFKTVKDSDTIVEQTYSVKANYVDVVLADTEHKKYNKRVFDMVTALDTYINSSRVYFGIETDSDKITEINSAIDKITVVIPSEIETPVFNETMYYGSSLILDSGVKVRHYIKIADGTDISKFKLAVNGNDITDAELTKSGIKSGSDDVYFFETDEFNPIDFDKKVSVTYDGTNVIDKYSVLSYIKLALNNETTKDTKLGTMCKALYNYYVEAGKY